MKTPKTPTTFLPRQFMEWGIIVLLVAMPFHAFIVIVLGHVVGAQALWQSWKEVLVVLLAATAVWVFVQDKKPFKRDASNVTALIIILLGLALMLVCKVPFVPALFGIKTVLLPLVLYLIIQLGQVKLKDDILTKIILRSSYAVAAIALLQEYVIPQSWWSALGYNELTIRPLQLVDPAVKSIRAFATLGGPNQLGAYLILPTILGLSMFWRTKKPIYALGSILTLGGIIVAFSRSAWLGAAVAITTLVLLLGGKVVRIAVVASALLALVALLTISSTLPQRLQGTKIQYFLLHGRYSQTQEIEGSDVGRISAQQKSITVITQQPWGHGLGIAGPASFQGNNPQITENWYLQIGIELGIAGVILFLVFFGANIINLIKLQSALSLALAASIVGLLITNVFLHAWADSTLGIMVFSLMGLKKVKES